MSKNVQNIWKNHFAYEISHDKTWIGLRRENIKRETKPVLTVAHNKAIRTNYIKAKIDNMQQNGKCALCEKRDEIISAYTPRTPDKPRLSGKGFIRICARN